MKLLTSLAVLSVAAGGLAWAVGIQPFAKRAVAFGVVLVVVRNALLYQGGALLHEIQPYVGTVLTALAALVVLIAVGRMVMARRPREEPRLGKKRRVARGP